MNTSLQFLIQADFLTTSSREAILTHRAWNLRLRDEIAPLFGDATRLFLERKNLRYDWLEYIPTGITDPFMIPIMTAIKSTIRLLGEDEQQHQPGDLVIVPEQFQTDHGTPLISERYIHPHRYLSLRYNTCRDATVLRYLGVKTMSPNDFVDALQTMDRAGSHVLPQQGTDWFERVSNVLRTFGAGFLYGRHSQIRKLRIIPLQNGTWVSAATPNVFFDGSLSDIPADLELNLVDSNRLPEHSFHHQLIAALGVTRVVVSDIISQIVRMHDVFLPANAQSSLLTHAKFVFRHGQHRTYNLRVLCKDGQTRMADSVYMDSREPHAPAGLQPSVLLEPHGAAILHHSYYDNAPCDAKDAWFRWLHSCLRINTCPRIVHGELSSEFSKFVHFTSTSTFLSALQYYWNQLSQCFTYHCRAQKELADVEVLCSDGTRRPLRSTFLKRRALQQFRDLPFLPLSHPESDTWDFLSILGVNMSLNSAFYLKRLIECSGQATVDKTEEDILEIYTQLQARFNDDSYNAEIK